MDIDCTDLVSVILPAYNAERYIGDAIKSVLNQTYPYFELIVVDDGSKDKTVEVVKSFKDKRIRLIQHLKNKGVSAARNTALKVAKGKWIAVIDADDEWLPNRLEVLLKILCESGDDYFVGDEHIICFDTSYGLKPWRSAFKSNFNIRFVNNIAEFSLIDFIKAELPAIPIIFPVIPVRKYGLQYNTSITYMEDFEFYCHLFRVGLKLKLYKEPFYLRRLTPGSITGNPNNIWDQVKVLNLLSSDPRFTAEERNLFKSKLEKVREKALYREFAYVLKAKKFSKAVHLTLKHPSLPIKLLCNVPHSLRYRFAAKRAGGRIKWVKIPF